VFNVSKCCINSIQFSAVTHSVCFSIALVDVKWSLLQYIFTEFCAVLRMTQMACTALENWLLKLDFMHFRHKNNKIYIKKYKLCFIILFLADLIYSLTQLIFGDRTLVWKFWIHSGTNTFRSATPFSFIFPLWTTVCCVLE